MILILAALDCNGVMLRPEFERVCMCALVCLSIFNISALGKRSYVTSLVSRSNSTLWKLPPKDVYCIYVQKAGMENDSGTHDKERCEAMADTCNPTQCFLPWILWWIHWISVRTNINFEFCLPLVALGEISQWLRIFSQSISMLWSCILVAHGTFHIDLRWLLSDLLLKS